MASDADDFYSPFPSVVTGRRPPLAYGFRQPIGTTWTPSLRV